MRCGTPGVSSESQIGAAAPTAGRERANKTPSATGDAALAFIIVSAHQVTDSRSRTVRARPLALCAVLLAAVAIGTGAAAGYLVGRSQGAIAPPTGPALLDLRRPEARALVDRVGSLAGRLTRLEIEAANLAKKLGVSSGPGRSPAPAAPGTGASGVEKGPSGGPLLPVDDAPSLRDATTAAVGDYGTGLAQLELELAMIESSIEQLADVAAERDLTDMAYPNRLPVFGTVPRISSGFGVRHDPFTGRLARHMGLDIPAAQGTAILASGGGRVVSAGFRGPYGNAVVIDHGNGLQTLYGHCSRLFVRTGDLVMPRQKIAAVGSTGRSTGPHLHFEVIRDGTRVEPGRILASVLARPAD